MEASILSQVKDRLIIDFHKKRVALTQPNSVNNTIGKAQLVVSHRKDEGADRGAVAEH